MVNKPRNKGTAAETLAVRFLQDNGWPYAERRALAGGSDLGDVSGCPGLVWEIKAAGAGVRMAEWVAETTTEKQNAKANHGILVIKPRGMGAKKVGRWFAVLSAEDFFEISSTSTENIVISAGEAQTYRKDKLAYDLSTWEKEHVGLDYQYVVPVLVRKPPGSTETPDEWYWITYFEKIVTLLRSSGYGNPLE